MKPLCASLCGCSYDKKIEGGCENKQFMNIQYFLEDTDCLLMESTTRASKAPQKGCLVQAAPLKNLRNHLAQLYIAKKVGIRKASWQCM